MDTFYGPHMGFYCYKKGFVLAAPGGLWWLTFVHHLLLINIIIIILFL